MRVTNQMLQLSAQKAGIQMEQTTLLDMLNKKNTGSIFDCLNTTDSAVTKLQKSNYEELEEAAGELDGYASELAATGEDSLFAKAEESGSSEEIVAAIKSMAEAYNTATDKLQDSSSALDKFYYQELQTIVSDNAVVLKTVGITQASDGTISIDTKTLESASVSDLKAVFGSTGTFSGRMSYVSDRVEQNAAANVQSLSSQYTSSGTSAYLNSANTYDFLG